MTNSLTAEEIAENMGIDVKKLPQCVANPNELFIPLSRINSIQEEIEKGLDLIHKKANQLRSSADIRDMNVIINLVRPKLIATCKEIKGKNG